MTFWKPLAFGLTLVLSGCASTPDRFAVIPAQSETRQSIAFRSVELRDLSLPAYAAADEIVTQSADGTLTTQDTLWADSPPRAVALELSRALAQITGARVASDPWPFSALPDASLDVRFETFVPDEAGLFRAVGQYFVAVPDGRERAGLFDLSVPYTADAGLPAIARARGQIIADLAAFIARDGLR